jgi:hypothetical protein
LYVSRSLPVYWLFEENRQLTLWQDIDTPLSEELLELREFAFTEGPGIVSQFTETELPEGLRPQRQDIQSFVETIFQDAVSVLLERYMTARPSQRADARPGTPSVLPSGESDSGYSGDHPPQGRVGNVASQQGFASGIMTSLDMESAGLFNGIHSNSTFPSDFHDDPSLYSHGLFYGPLPPVEEWDALFQRAIAEH